MCRHSTDVGEVVRVNRLGDVAGDVRWRSTDLAGQPEGDARRQHGVDVLRWLLDTEVLGRQVEGCECVVEGVLDLRTELQEHTPGFRGGE